MSASSKIIQAAAGNVAGGAVEPVGIEFDGTNDYLSRSSDLTGNSDTKTFTFSCWVYPQNKGSSQFLYDVTGGGYFRFALSASGEFSAQGLTSGAALALQMETPSGSVPFNTWSHLLISVDLANNQGSIFINDVSQTLATNTKNNLFIDSSRTGAGIADQPAGGFGLEGRLAGVYLDYTYRDLSVEANRRLFIDDDGLYVTPPTSGIISVPMDDPADPGRNDGTGGDFTLNGVVAQSGRGPNQYNAAASTFDGSADYLSRTSLTGIADGKTFTFSCLAKHNSFNNDPIISIEDSGNLKFVIRFSNGGSFGYLTVIGQQSGAATNVLQLGDTDTKVYLNKWHSIQISMDLSDTSKRHVFIDGEEITGLTYSTYTNTNIDFTTSDYAIGAPAGIFNRQFDGDLSDVWFDTSFMDLTSDNPFYDSETGKPKYLGASGELPTGSSPLIYTPLRAGDAGNNLGIGGDFTVNSGPYTGARGPSEHWEESVEFDGTGNNHLKLNTATISDSKEFTVFLAFKPDDSGTHDWFELSGYNGSSRFTVLKVFTTGTSGSVEISSQDSSDYSNRLRAVGSGTINTDEWNTLLISGSMTSSSTFKVYLNGSDVTDNKFNYDNENLEFSKLATQGDSSGLYIGRQPLGGNPADGGGAIYYIDNVYTDFSQEANRLKFLDAFNNPTDIAAKIDSEEIAQPLIYLPFDDKTNLGKNSGTLGDFTEVGTLTDDGYVNG